jgi:hypothetical protein
LSNLGLSVQAIQLTGGVLIGREWMMKQRMRKGKDDAGRLCVTYVIEQW